MAEGGGGGRRARKTAARRPRGPVPRLGLALGAGAARGFAHVGVLRGLAELGIEPVVVAGTSMGALVGALYVGGGFADFEDWARHLTWRQIVRFFDVRLAGGGIVEGRRLMAFLEGLQHDRPIEELPKPFAAVATDFATGREVWIERGSWLAAVRASIALPGFLRPVEQGGRWLVDGGLVDPVPVAACRALGAETIIAVNVNGDLLPQRHGQWAANGGGEGGREELDGLLPDLPRGLRELLQNLAGPLSGRGALTPGYFEVVYGAILIMQDRIIRSRLAGDPPDLLLVPRVGEIGLFEFHRASEAIEEGYQTVMRARPALEAVLRGAATGFQR